MGPPWRSKYSPTPRASSACGLSCLGDTTGKALRRSRRATWSRILGCWRGEGRALLRAGALAARAHARCRVDRGVGLGRDLREPHPERSRPVVVRARHPGPRSGPGSLLRLTEIFYFPNGLEMTTCPERRAAVW